ncbi:MAG TPA: hypothetical protein VLI06_05150 [Solimonas sp.]|nr:hypothetical protein [Solimonas sp.]
MASLLPHLLAVLVALLPGTIGAARAEPLVVIVNPASGVEKLSREEAVNIFMGRYRKLPSGILAFPIDIGSQSPERQQFYRLLVRKDLPEIDAYWARLVFSGQTSPPLQAPDGATAVQLVASNRSAIAYVDRALVDARVKVVIDFGRAAKP